MAKIKSYTDIEQSKKLAEIIPLESADMYYWCADHYPKEDWIIEVGKPDDNYERVCAWSLAALLGVLPNEDMLVKTTDGEYYCLAKDVMTKHYDNPIDACYEMILKLHERNLL